MMEIILQTHLSYEGAWRVWRIAVIKSIYITENEERVVSWLEYIEMCVEYEKNHK